jgi:hypothetical protein
MMTAQVTPVGEHGIRAAKETLPFVRNTTLFADKACYDQAGISEMKKQGI